MAVLDLTVRIHEEGGEKLKAIQDKLTDTGKMLTRRVTLPILAAGTGVIKLAGDAEKSHQRIQQTFDTMNAGAWTTVEALEAQAQAFQDATTFGDEAIRDAQATMLTFRDVTGGVFDDALQGAIDMAAFLDKDLQDAVIIVGKAVNDPEKGMATLRRMGVQFTPVQEQLVRDLVAVGDTAGAQAVIIGELQDQFGGQAWTEAQTSMGQVEQSMHKLSDAGESIGLLLLPVLAQMADILKGLAEWFIGLDEGVKGFIVTAAALLAILGPVLWIGGQLIGAFRGLLTIILNIPTVIGFVTHAFSLVAGAFKALTLLLLANPFVALAAAVVALTALIVLNWDAIVDVFKGALRWMKQTGEKLWTPLSEGFKAAIGAIKGVWNSFAGWWNRLAISVPTIDIPFVGKVGGFTIDLPDLPMLAKGGIVTQPTLALIGEAGPEAVVPLDGRHGMGSGPVVNLTINGDVRGDERRLPGQMLRALYVAGVSS